MPVRVGAREGRGQCEGQPGERNQDNQEDEGKCRPGSEQCCQLSGFDAKSSYFPDPPGDLVGEKLLVTNLKTFLGGLANIKPLFFLPLQFNQYKTPKKTLKTEISRACMKKY